MKLVAMLPKHKFDAQLQDYSLFPYKVLNSSVCDEMVDGSEKAIIRCTVKHFENANPGVQASINCEAELAGKTLKERYRMIRTSLIQAAAASGTWQVTVDDFILANANQRFGAGGEVTVVMTIRSRRSDIQYNTNLASKKSYSYVVTTGAMCDNIVKAVFYIATVRKCEAKSFRKSKPGLEGDLRVMFSMTHVAKDEAFERLAKVIVDCAKKSSHWDISMGDLKVAKISGSTTTFRMLQFQLPVMLLLSFVIQLITS